jgi:hypothetical protein
MKSGSLKVSGQLHDAPAALLFVPAGVNLLKPIGYVMHQQV